MLPFQSGYTKVFMIWEVECLWKRNEKEYFPGTLLSPSSICIFNIEYDNFHEDTPLSTCGYEQILDGTNVSSQIDVCTYWGIMPCAIITSREAGQFIWVSIPRELGNYNQCLPAWIELSQVSRIVGERSNVTALISPISAPDLGIRNQKLFQSITFSICPQLRMVLSIFEGYNLELQDNKI